MEQHRDIKIYFPNQIMHVRSVLTKVIWMDCSYLNRNISDVLWEAVSKGQVLSLYQGLWTKNLQSFISQFIYFYGYSFFKRLYLRESGSKSIGTTANLLIAAAAGTCTAIVTQVSHCELMFWFYLWRSVYSCCITFVFCTLINCVIYFVAFSDLTSHVMIWVVSINVHVLRLKHLLIRSML